MATSGQVRIQEAPQNGINWVGFKAPENITQTQVWTLPSIDGAPGQALITDGSGNLNWEVFITPTTLSYEFTQTTNLSVWAITHNLNKKPSITALNDSGDLLFGDVEYIDNNSLLFKLNVPTTGKAYLN